MTSRKYEYVIVDVFTNRPFKGNPLAVLPDAAGLSDVQMQTIAGEFNLSETVFLLPPVRPEASLRARIFTPRRELPYAGHPTIGAAALFANRNGVTTPFLIEEQVGTVKIDAGDDRVEPRLFWLTTPPVTFYESLDPEFCASLLGLDIRDLRSHVRPRFASAGTPLLFIWLASMDAVDRARLQQQYLSQALGSVDSVGTFVFARKEPDSRTSFDVYSRMFAPQIGITEDPATGGATGPLAAYMMRCGLLSDSEPVAFVSEQGTQMGRQSFLHVQTNAVEHTIKVGGSTVEVARGTLTMPIAA
jgi:trans-2,3-dihydro-3-hydroxyanthranilate isomerase